MDVYYVYELNNYTQAFYRAMTLDESEAQAILEQYSGPRYEIERHTTVIIFFLKLYWAYQLMLIINFLETDSYCCMRTSFCFLF